MRHTWFEETNGKIELVFAGVVKWPVGILWCCGATFVGRLYTMRCVEVCAVFLVEVSRFATVVLLLIALEAYLVPSIRRLELLWGCIIDKQLFEGIPL